MADSSYGVSDHHIELYRRKAEECRKQADKSFNSQDKESWLCLADDWTKMAEKVERRLDRDGELSQRRLIGMENPDRAQIILRAVGAGRQP
jgi:hypothetical protein